MDDRLLYRVWNKECNRWHDSRAGKPMWYLPGDPDGAIYEYEQCTGIHDSKGKMIYEGDIMESATGCHVVVRWHDGAWRIKGTWEGKSVNYMLSRYRGTLGEIVGNIHDDAHLLEGCDD